MQQLEQIVMEMEKGDLPLEKALKKFEEGMSLAKFCSEKLDETEQKITLLMQTPDGNAQTAPFPNAASAADPAVDNTEEGRDQDGF